VVNCSLRDELLVLDHVIVTSNSVLTTVSTMVVQVSAIEEPWKIVPSMFREMDTLGVGTEECWE